MTKKQKCQACRDSKKGCSRDGHYNDQDPETRCRRCKKRNLICGPDIYTHENDQGEPTGTPDTDQISGAVDAGTTSLPAPPSLEYDEASLQRSLRDLGNSQTFQFVRQTTSSLENTIVPGELRRTLKAIETLADLAHASEDLSNAEVAYTRLIEWYYDLGPEVKEQRELLTMKLGSFYEKIGYHDQAERSYLRIFDRIPRADSDPLASLQHAIRNFNKVEKVGQAALMGMIRACPLCRFKQRNGEGETPLFVAASVAAEWVVVAILKRIRDPHQQPRINSTYLDATTRRGLTILSAAVIAGCSIPLIEALIMYGCRVNPQTWPDGPQTPLQAASNPIFERPYVARLLLHHNADPSYIWQNSRIAMIGINNLEMPPEYPSLYHEIESGTLEVNL